MMTIKDNSIFLKETHKLIIYITSHILIILIRLLEYDVILNKEKCPTISNGISRDDKTNLSIE